MYKVSSLFYATVDHSASISAATALGEEEDERGAVDLWLWGGELGEAAAVEAAVAVPAASRGDDEATGRMLPFAAVVVIVATAETKEVEKEEEEEGAGAAAAAGGAEPLAPRRTLPPPKPLRPPPPGASAGEVAQGPRLRART